jgi:alpha-tubulin suppressor-like RCC1 family protein
MTSPTPRSPWSRRGRFLQVTKPSRKTGIVTTLVLLAVAALPTVSASGAYFADQVSVPSNSVGAATLDAVAAPTIERTGTPTGVSANVSWSSALDLPWAKQNSVTNGVNYTVTRATSETSTDGRVIDIGTDLAATDSGNNPTYRPSTVTTGSTHACALTSKGEAYCWGANNVGQLGIGSTTSKQTPTAVSTTGVLAGKKLVSISTNPNSTSTCALDDGGVAYCWGDNSAGQLGTGTTASAQSPISVVRSGALQGKTLTSISVGATYTCATDSVGAAYCWGQNDVGQLGNGSTTNSLSPVAVQVTGALASKSLISISAGSNSTCAIDSEGLAYCWGMTGAYPSLSEQNNSPKAVTTTGVLKGKVIKQISIGLYTTCAVDTQGSAYCWGSNTNGSLGNSTTTDSATPVAVTTAQKFATISVGNNFACGVTTTSTVSCWGQNSNGQLGTNNTTQYLVPTNAYSSSSLAGKTVNSVSAGFTSTCVVDTAGGAYCSGANTAGKLGNNSTAASLQLTTVVAPSVELAFKQLSTQRDLSCGIAENDRLYCWGDNSRYGLGTGSSAPASTGIPTLVNSGGLINKTVRTVNVSDNMSVCAVDTNGATYCWGNNAGSSLGVAGGGTSNVTSPTLITGEVVGKDIIDVVQGVRFGCALSSAGKVYCWGNSFAGNGNATTSANPSYSSVLKGGSMASSTVMKITNGYNQNYPCAVDNTGKVFCWGYKSGRYDINGSTTSSEYDSPTQIMPAGAAAGKIVTSLSRGNTTRICFTAADGTYAQPVNEKVYCVAVLPGDGNTSTAITTSPVAVAGLPSGQTITNLQVGGGNSCALMSNKTVYCWGTGSDYQNGDGTTANRATAVLAAAVAPGSVESLSKVTAASYCATLDSGQFQCWGGFVYGANANGSASPSSTASYQPPTAGTRPYTSATFGTSLPACSFGAVISGDGCTLAPGRAYVYTVSYGYQGWLSGLSKSKG